MKVASHFGSAQLQTRFKIPVAVDRLSDDEFRKLAWAGFKMLVADTDVPPADFVVDVESVSNESA